MIISMTNTTCEVGFRLNDFSMANTATKVSVRHNNVRPTYITR